MPYVYSGKACVNRNGSLPQDSVLNGRITLSLPKTIATIETKRHSRARTQTHEPVQTNGNEHLPLGRSWFFSIFFFSILIVLISWVHVVFWSSLFDSAIVQQKINKVNAHGGWVDEKLVRAFAREIVTPTNNVNKLLSYTDYGLNALFIHGIRALHTIRLDKERKNKSFCCRRLANEERVENGSARSNEPKCQCNESR